MAESMKTARVNIPTADGVCDAFTARPPEAGPFPGVILLMDAFGLRPYLEQMGERLASYGYFVLVPNLFYRVRPAPVLDVSFPVRPENLPEARTKLRALVGNYDYEGGLRDMGAFLDFLAQEKHVRAGKVGLTGYCMGGGLAIRAAGRFPSRVGAVASFHGGNLATDAPLSPVSFAEQIRAKVYVAHADHDSSMPPEQIERFEKAFRRAGVDFEAELYEGAEHGFTMEDLPAHHAGALSRHWEKLPELLREGLR